MASARQLAELLKMPKTIRQLEVKTGACDLIEVMRAHNNFGGSPVFLYRAGRDEEGLRRVVYWVSRRRKSLEWWRAFARLEINPELGEVV